VTGIKVAHVTTDDRSQRYLLLNLLLHLKKTGFEITSVSTAGPDVPTLEEVGIRHVPVPMRRSPFTPLHDLVALWRLYRLFRRERFTIVHTHNPKPGFLGQMAAKLARVPIIVNTVHGFYFHDHMHPALRRFYITLEKLAGRWSSVMFSQNQEDTRTAEKLGIGTVEKVKFLGTGIDVEYMDPGRISPEARAAKRQELDIPDGAPVVGFVGRLVREKGVVEMLEAARIIHEHRPEVRFIFVGPVDLVKKDAFDPIGAASYGIDDVISFLGMRPDMPELYSIMDVMALPSYREGLPRAPMEASAMEIPCVVTDIRGCREVIEDGVTGLLVPRQDSAALAKALIELLEDPERARQMGRQGRKAALEKFDERTAFRFIEAEYRRLLDERGIEKPPV
jgi:glycosyltransferase involved in cell wall biosynthesis